MKRIDRATRIEIAQIAQDLDDATAKAKRMADEHADECGLKGDQREAFVTAYVSGAIIAQLTISATHLRSLLGVPS